MLSAPSVLICNQTSSSCSSCLRGSSLVAATGRVKSWRRPLRPSRLRTLVFPLALVVILRCLPLLALSNPVWRAENPSQTRPGSEPANLRSLADSLEKAATQGQSAKVREILTQLLQQAKMDPTLLLKVGIGLAQREFYSEAAQMFYRCVKDYPNLFEAHYNLALADLALQKHSEALTVLEHSPHGTKSQELARLYLRGKILEALGHPLQAEQDLSTAFSGAPQQENYALDLGLFYLRQRVYPKAAEAFARGKEFHPRSIFLLLGLSLAQFLSGHTTESIDICRKLLELQPGFSPAQLLLGFAFYQNGNFEESETVAAAGLSAANPQPYLRYLHAAALLKLQSKEYDRLLRELALADKAIPNCILCALAQSKVHQATGNLGAAIAELERAVALEPAFSEAWYHLSLVYARVGRPLDAARASAEFSKLRTEKRNRDTELLRDLFLKTLSGQE